MRLVCEPNDVAHALGDVALPAVGEDHGDDLVVGGALGAEHQGDAPGALSALPRRRERRESGAARHAGERARLCGQAREHLRDAALGGRPVPELGDGPLAQGGGGLVVGDDEFCEGLHGGLRYLRTNISVD